MTTFFLSSFLNEAPGYNIYSGYTIQSQSGGGSKPLRPKGSGFGSDISTEPDSNLGSDAELPERSRVQGKVLPLGGVQP